ncbi:tyrosine-type recombinase/integrase [Phyllobacterium zundukense]|uniref:Tyr recombinase domain-containing protein n=1 Tax=Phyllobacterium zundukense TaxID=1867719 RepID=A0A2N9VQC2_9HYPH|nr:site-specific integrase [Phyllobacterium zundukense]ATU90703.1 hypothetical protein BLM14_02855 [Phyllobacterium zundukense]PIO41690.1 hypothetical protein B5P45_27470 [Phyllobacterium zundukense]
MYVSVEKNFIFVHVAKTGGQALKRALRPYAVQKASGQWRRLLSHLPVPEGPDIQFGPHASIRWAKLKLPRNFFDGAFKFGLVRNPYDLAVSRYAFVRGQGDHHRHEHAQTQSFLDFLRLERRRALWLPRDQSSMLCDFSGTLDKQGRAVLVTMLHTWKALQERFGTRDGESITKEDCRAHTADRRQTGIADGTIHTELGHLRTVLVWAEKNMLIGKAPEIERPSKPDPKDRHLTREEAQRILEAAKTPHLKTAIHLMLGTAARVTAILELTWDRVDFDRRLIYLRDPSDKVKRKGRAIVPINATLLTALRDAKAGALTEYVVEWAGQPVKSLKRGIATAANNADVKDVSAHVFRHTAAVWMAEASVPMEEISQYLGHSNVEITRRVYARYSPDHLRKAASASNLAYT